MTDFSVVFRVTTIHSHFYRCALDVEIHPMKIWPIRLHFINIQGTLKQSMLCEKFFFIISSFLRYANAVNGEQDIIGNGDDTENSYFRRKPTSFLRSNDPKRFTWMKDGEQQLDNAPFIIDSHQNAFTNRAGSFRCASHSGVTSSILSGGDSNTAPRWNMEHFCTLISVLSNVTIRVSFSFIPLFRTKHVSFARSHTLTSFDEVSVGSLARSASRLNTAKSQERLIGGKKVTNSPETQSRFFNSNNQPIVETNRIKTANDNFGTNISNSPSEAAIIEKLKRNVKKTQATQTDVFSGRRSSMRSNMSSTSPRSSQRVNPPYTLCAPASLRFYSLIFIFIYFQ